MRTRNLVISIFQTVWMLTATLLFAGCVSGDAKLCTLAYCVDTVDVSLKSEDNGDYPVGVYAVKIIFADGVEIEAGFVVASNDTDDFAEDAGDSGAVALGNRIWKSEGTEGYPYSWDLVLNDEENIPVTIGFSGWLPREEGLLDYEFTDEFQLVITRDDVTIYSERVVPDYEFYWCNGSSNCDRRENKSFEMEVSIN